MTTVRYRYAAPPQCETIIAHEDVDNIIRTNKAALWPCQLPSHHRQLKQYISTAEKDILYYISDRAIYAIHIPTNRQELVTPVQFPPTCIAAGHGWVCVGGVDGGKCLFVDLRRRPPFGQPASSWSLEVDETLPLNLDPHSRRSRDHTQQDSDSTQSRRRRFLEVEIGKEIVNGITIANFENGGTKEVVAVVSGNDKTVTIFSLTQEKVLKVIVLSKEINHATISPNGELMVIVGDCNKVWFYKREIKSLVSKYVDYDWRQVAMIRIIATIGEDWSFSTSWSPSGHICMVASQLGVLEVYDTSKINRDMTNTSAVFGTIRSPRYEIENPGTLIPTAVRSIAFSPKPWDLVAWAENCGKVTVVDLRDGCMSRQTIQVDIDSPKVEHIKYSSISSSLQLLQQLQQENEREPEGRQQDAQVLRDLQVAIRHNAEQIDDMTRRLSEDTMFQEAQGRTTPLASSEMGDRTSEILGLMRTLGQHSINAREDINMIREFLENPRPFSINYPSARDLQPNRHLMPRADLLQRPDTRRTLPWSTPQRRASVVMSQSSERPSTAHPASLTPGLAPTLSRSPSRLPNAITAEHTPYRNPIQDNPHLTPITSETLRGATLRARLRTADPNIRGLADLAATVNPSDLRRSTYDTLPLTLPDNTSNGSSQGTYLQYRQRIVEDQRQLQALESSYQAPYQALADPPSLIPDTARALAADQAEWERRRREIQNYQPDVVLNESIHGIEIQGLGWSHDGRYLIVATVRGIMRYEVDIPRRMRTPALYLR